MRHNASGRKLGRTTAHRLAMFRNQLASLVASERIVTTISKAKELRPLAEKMITQGKRGTVHARRLVGRWVPNRELVKKLFDEIAPRFETRPGGYLRIVKLGSRQGDGAEMAVLEFVDFAAKAKPAAETRKGKKAAKAGAVGAAAEGSDAAAEPDKKKAKAARTAKAGSKKPAERKTVAKVDVRSKGRATTKSPVAKKTSGPKKTGGS